MVETGRAGSPDNITNCVQISPNSLLCRVRVEAKFTPAFIKT